MTDQRNFWIFAVVGGEPFDIRVKGNLPLVHDGKRSVVRCLCTDEQAESLKTTMLGTGSRVTVASPREEPEQTVERNNVFAILGNKEAVWPTNMCPQCAWLDVTLEGLCGAGMQRWKELPGWHESAIRERLTVAKFAADHAACPLGSIQEPR